MFALNFKLRKRLQAKVKQKFHDKVIIISKLEVRMKHIGCSKVENYFVENGVLLIYCKFNAKSTII